MATTPTTTTPPSTPIIYGPLNIEYLNESWCELQYKSGCSSTGSISHLNHSVNPEVLEKLLQEAQKESQSPVSNGPPLLPSLLPDITNQTKTPPLLKSFDSFSTMSSVCVVNNSARHHHQDQNTTTSFVNNQTSSSTTTIHNKTRDTTVSSVSSEIISVVPMSDTSSVVYSQASGGKLKMRIVGGSENRNIIRPSASASSSMFMPIRRESSSETDVCSSRMFVYDDDDDDEIFCQDDVDDDDDVDLEYVEDEEDEECNRINSNNLNNNTLTDQAGSQLIHNEMKASMRQRNKKRKHHETCKHCNKHRQEINNLLEKQINQEKELIRLRNEYEIKLLNKSLELSTHSSKSSTTSNNITNQSTNQTKMINATSSPSGPLSPPSFSSSSSTGGQASPIYPPVPTSFSSQSQQDVGGGGGSATAAISTKDWMKYFASRPQSLPPKEWNLVHPNSQQARCGGGVAQQTKLVGSSRVSDNLVSRDDMMTMPTLAECCSSSTNTDDCGSLKLLGSESVSISKLIFTHVASFIVGATLMFLVLRKHLNFRGSIYFI